MSVLAIDLDDTIHDTQNVLPGYKMGQPTTGAVDAIKKLHDDGHTIVIFTARNVQDPRVYRAVKDWLGYFKIPHHAITNIKRPEYDLMIDDKALKFEYWAQVLEAL